MLAGDILGQVNDFGLPSEARVYIDLNLNQELDAGEPFADTDSNGNYRILGASLNAGDRVTLRIEAPDQDSIFAFDRRVDLALFRNQSRLFDLGSDTEVGDIAIGDFDGDLTSDIVVVQRNPFGFNTGTFEIFEGQADGTYPATSSASHTNVNLGLFKFDAKRARLATGDLDQDGKDDLVFVTGDQGNVVVQSQYNGNSFVTDLLASVSNPLDVIVDNFDASVGPEIAVLSQNSSQKAEIHLFQRNGALDYDSTVTETDVEFPGGFTSGDYNGDGHLDIALFGVESSQVAILPGTGDGGFGSAITSTLKDDSDDTDLKLTSAIATTSPFDGPGLIVTHDESTVFFCNVESSGVVDNCFAELETLEGFGSGNPRGAVNDITYNDRTGSLVVTSTTPVNNNVVASVQVLDTGGNVEVFQINVLYGATRRIPVFTGEFQLNGKSTDRIAIAAPSQDADPFGPQLGLKYSDDISISQYPLLLTANDITDRDFDAPVDPFEVSVTATSPQTNEDGSGTLVYTFARERESVLDLAVNYEVAGTAMNGVDYPALSGTITIPAGSLEATLVIDPTDDDLLEPDETVVVNLAFGRQYTLGALSSATGTITNDEPLPTVTVSASPLSVDENGTNSIAYTFTRVGDDSQALTVTYDVGGTATPGDDYAALAGTVTIAAGSSSASVVIDPNDDDRVEPDETIVVTVTDGGNYDVGTPASASGTIVNDDSDPTVSVAVSPSSVNEDGVETLTYTFTRVGDDSQELAVTYDVGGTATPGDDYAALAGTITIAAGASSASVVIDPNDDDHVEPDETIVVTVTDGGNYDVGTASVATATILNDDALFDFGDAPAASQSGFANSYPVTLDQDGARHAQSSALRLGSELDYEPDGLPDDLAGTDTAGGDDNTDVADEDGLTLGTSVVSLPASATDSSLLINASAQGKLDGWIDFDQDGTWSLSEQVFDSVNLSQGTNQLAFSVPAGTTIGGTYARFRLSSAGGLSPTGLADDGEVEDHRLVIIDQSQSPIVSLVDQDAILEVIDDRVTIGNSTGTLFSAPSGSLPGITILGNAIENDILIDVSALAENAVQVDGGLGDDAIVLLGPSTSVDLTSDGNLNASQIETIDLTDSSQQILVLDRTAVSQITSSRLRIRGGEEDDLRFDDPGDWRMGETSIVDGRFIRSIENIDTADSIDADLSRPWQNIVQAGDVNNNGEVTSLDALAIINELGTRAFSNREDARLLDPLQVDAWPGKYYDQNGDDNATALDALRVINELGRINAVSAEAESIVGVLPVPTSPDVSTVVDERVPEQIDATEKKLVKDTRFRPARSVTASDLFFAQIGTGKQNQSRTSTLDVDSHASDIR